MSFTVATFYFFTYVQLLTRSLISTFISTWYYQLLNSRLIYNRYNHNCASLKLVQNYMLSIISLPPVAMSPV